MSIQYVAGNWKLNKGPKEAAEFLQQFQSQVADTDQKKFMLFLPALTLGAVAHQIKNLAIHWGAQNVYFEEEGAFTGENSAKVLSELGCTHCLVGHSERRQVFNETDDQLAKKVLCLQNNSIEPMLCVGETLEQREAGQTMQVIESQLKQGLEHVQWGKPLSLAYEPVWAIGTGKVATPEIAEEAHAHLRKVLKEIGGDTAERTPILYGGSVKPGNASELGEKPNIDGFLVGGASLDPQSFVDIYKNSI
ncbi:MAG: triose-phosphate isomerase [Bdellovibrionaceae bacterium]|nr:triose-phosphate isomerase [Pseudobdellovibrionaceae bacterium]|tara:strand:- start:433 stop:1179 length:747 start_codon:yes stop_codon:yes gene_type:complete